MAVRRFWDIEAVPMGDGLLREAILKSGLDPAP
jgi:hypothetical protein